MVNKKSRFVIEIAIVASVILLMHLVLFGHFLSNYYISDDELALVANSTNHTGQIDVASWFSQGFSRYFITYPEWTSPYTNFLRPVVNVTFFFQHLLFRDAWRYYLLFNYLVSSAGVLFVYLFARKLLKQNAIISSITSAVFFVASFTYVSYIYPATPFDMLAGVLVMAAFLCVMREKILLSALLLTLALLTKETVIFASAAAAITLFILYLRKGAIGRKQILNCLAVFVLPVVIFLCLRFLFFSGFAGAYIIDMPVSFKARVIKLVRAFESWPTFLVGEKNLAALQSIYYKNINFKNLFLASLVAINYLGVAVAVFGFVTVVRKLLAARKRNLPKVQLLNIYHIFLVWMVGISLVLVVFALTKRFAYTFFAFSIPLCIYFLKDFRSHKFFNVALVLFLVVTTVNGALAITPALAGQNRVSFANSKKNARQLITILAESDKNRQVILVNDITGYFGATWLRSVACRCSNSGQIYVVNSVLGNFSSMSNAEINIVETSLGLEIAITLPESGRLYFPGADMNKMIALSESQSALLGSIPRGSALYLFEDSTIRHSKLADKNVIDFGRNLTAHLSLARKDPLIIFYDFNAAEYRIWQ